MQKVEELHPQGLAVQGHLFLLFVGEGECCVWCAGKGDKGVLCVGVCEGGFCLCAACVHPFYYL